MKKKYSIKSTYSDALYWATSTQSKDKGYHLTRTQEAILRKLIHYAHSHEKITYSNVIIAQHTFSGEETIRKAIPELAKKGYISKAIIKIVDSGKFITRRTILIKWDFLETVLANVPKQEETNQEVSSNNKSLDVDLTETVNAPIADELDMNSKSNQTSEKSTSILTTSDSYPIPEIVITDEKLRWLKELSGNPILTKEQIEDMGQEALEKIFYNGTGIWEINKDSSENQYMMKLTHRGGSLGKLYDTSKNNDKIEINVLDFAYYLNQKGIKFNKFTPNIYKDIKAFGLVKKPKDYKEPCYIL